MWVYSLLPKILNMSLTASVVILAVLLARLLLRRAPKLFSYVLWAAVLFRLLCPVSFSSPLSLLAVSDAPVTEAGTIEYIPPDIVHAPAPEVQLPLPQVAEVINETLPQGREQTVADPLEVVLYFGTVVWLLGIASLLIYSAAQLVRLRRKLFGAVLLRDNIYLADGIDSPFVMGLFAPKIYLPASLTEREREYIIAHEKQHVRRLDHFFKILAFAALCLHWFNPLVWLAFSLSGDDMEMSCDEAVMKKLGADVRGDYSASLLSLATGRRIISGTPLAFGEGDTKGRVKNVLNYRKPAFWVIIAALIGVLVLTVCLVANPEEETAEPPAFSGDGAFIAGEYLGQNPALSAWFPDGSQFGRVVLEHYALRLVNDEGETTFETVGSTVKSSGREALVKELSATLAASAEDLVPPCEEVTIYQYYLKAEDYPAQDSPGTVAYSIYLFDGVPAWFAQGEMLRIFELLPAPDETLSPEMSVKGGFDESDVPYPRISFHLRDNDGSRANPYALSTLYYLPVSEKLAEQCRGVLENPSLEESEPREYVMLFELELDKERRVTAFETMTGGCYFSAGLSQSGIVADEAVESLLKLVEEATGHNTGVELYDFKDAVGVELIRGEEVLWSTENQDDIDRMCALLDSYQGSSVSNFDNYDCELRCTLPDGSTILLSLSSDDGYIFIQPFRYYKLPAESPLRKTGWLDVFGWESWPEQAQ